jgi:tetratricopeptide (TPR) repeat protein
VIETYEMWTRTYPRDWTPHNNLANQYSAIGEHEKALEASRRTVELQPNHVFPWANLAGAYTALGRFDEAKAIYEQAMANGLDTHQFHWDLAAIAHVQGDDEEVRRQGEWHAGRPTAASPYMFGGFRLAEVGRLEEAIVSWNQGGQLAASIGMGGWGLFAQQSMANYEAEFGFHERARQRLTELEGMAPPSFNRSGRAVLWASLGDTARAGELLAAEIEETPTDTYLLANTAPRVRAAIAMAEGRPEDAVDELRATRFERASINIPYERGVALIAAGRPEEALPELQKVLDWVGIDVADPRKALARLGKAQAYVAMGDTEAARDAYLDFLEFWAQADEDLPVLQKARSEYEALPGVRG